MCTHALQTPESQFKYSQCPSNVKLSDFYGTHYSVFLLQLEDSLAWFMARTCQMNLYYNIHEKKKKCRLANSVSQICFGNVFFEILRARENELSPEGFLKSVCVQAGH